LSRPTRSSEEFVRSSRHEADENVPGLIGDLGSEQARVRSHVTRVLARLGASEAAPHLARLADEPAERVRGNALLALGALEAHEFEGTLMAGLADPEPTVRCCAAEALGRMQAIDAIPRLRQALDDDPDAEVRLYAVESLVVLGDKESRDRVAGALKAISWWVRGHPRWKRLRKAAETGEPLPPWNWPWE
jgi:HEAT repeat protein